MTSDDTQNQLETLKEVVGNLDLTPEDLLMVLSSVVSLKNKKKEEEQKGNKVITEKVYLWENSKDSYIYKDGRTKGGKHDKKVQCP